MVGSLMFKDPTDLSLPEIQQYLRYNPTTGEFIWAKKTGRGSVKLGDVAGHVCPDGYRVIKFKGKKLWAHRLAWLYVYGVWPSNFLDHKNRKRDHNIISNLREATPTQNGQNSTTFKNKKHSTFKGVTKLITKTGKAFTARIKKPDGVREFLGYFSSPEEAHAAYLEAAQKYYGEFAHG